MNYTDIYREIRDGTARGRLPGQVVHVMMAIARGAQPLAAVRHPLGFICLPVARHGECGVCVHVWTGHPPEVELTTSPMHSHSWDLLSYVLYGEVRNQLVQVADAPATPSHRVFEVHSHGDADEIRRTARLVHCTPGVAQSTTSGGSYRLAAGEFHMTVVAGQAATVVLGHSRAGTLDLSLGSLGTPTHRVPRQRCSRRETVTAATHVARSLTITSGAGDITVNRADRR
ncbi:MAG: hypothetical protein ACRDS0_25425 [Pseudonocardiaceae bacterium]